MFSPGTLLVVMAGGVIGVALRAVAIVPFTGWTHPLVVPGLTLACNIIGSFLLGFVVGKLGNRHARWRAFLGTGILGGFTTYSAFAVQSVDIAAASPVIGLLLVAVSLFGGVLAAAVGLSLATRSMPAPEDAE